MEDSCGVTVLSRDDSWLLEITKVDQELRDEEAALMQTRWFDYRHLLPAQATYLFADVYCEIYRELYAQTRDYRKADDIEPLMTADIFQSSELIPLWRARQAADRIGCRYRFFLTQAFHRIWNRGHRYLPRPNQLYGEELWMDIQDQWRESQKHTLQLAESPFFRNEAYRGHPNQDAYHAYLIEQIKKREHKHMPLARLIVREKMLPIEVAANHFNDALIRKAISFA